MARLTGSATQGGADAFVQAEVQTALEGQTTLAYKIGSIQFEVPLVGAITATTQIELCLTRRTKAAMPLITDADVLWKWRFATSITTSGAIIIPTAPVFTPANEILIVEPSVFFQIDSTATGLTQTANFVIEYDLVSISQLDRLTLLTQSLQ